MTKVYYYRNGELVSSSSGAVPWAMDYAIIDDSTEPPTVKPTPGWWYISYAAGLRSVILRGKIYRLFVEYGTVEVEEVL